MRNFAIVASQFHPELVRGLIDHFKEEAGVIAPNCKVAVYEVPGSFEIPIAVQEVVQKGGVDAVVAFGVILQGATQHATLIATSVTDALQQIAIASRVPVLHEVLLVADEEQARDRCLHEELNRGTEAARAAVIITETLSALRR